jgi:predicted RecA/RadA family phage recombinase
MANYAQYVQDGAQVDYTPAADTPAGTVVAQANLVGVTKKPIKAGQLGALAVEGVFAFPKSTAAGSGIAVGATVNWDPVNCVATAAASGGAPPATYTMIGKVVATAADAATTVLVRLHQ